MIKKQLFYFGSGALHANCIGVDGGKLIRGPLIRELAKSFDVIWCGYTKEERREVPLLKMFGIYHSPYFSADIRQLMHHQINPEEEGFTQRLDIVFTDKVYSGFENNTDSAEYQEYLRQNLNNSMYTDKARILFMELRPFEEKDGYNFGNEAHTQKELIEYWIKNGKKHDKIIVWDQDGWCQQIPKEYREHIILLHAYEEIPDYDMSDFKEHHYFLWGWDEKTMQDFTPHRINLPNDEKFDTVYCGNVYGRRDDFLKFMKPLHDEGKTMAIAGNWLRKKYDDRDFSLEHFPNALFLGQTEHWTTLPLLSRAKFCVHFANPYQQELGLIGIRVFEAFMAGTPLFVNGNIKGIEKYVHESQIIYSGEELIQKLKYYDLKLVYKLWKEKIKDYTVANQAKWLLKLITPVIEKPIQTFGVIS